MRGVFAISVALIGSVVSASAQGAAGSRPAASAGGIAIPQAPAVIARDAAGRPTIRAVRVTAPMRIDGRFDEAVYAETPSISDFIQQEPTEGAPASERTEVWVLFDDDNVYVMARLWESDMSRVVANEMRRDNTTIFSGNDHFAFVFDTFLDRRNIVLFEMNPLGGRIDGQVTNERQVNTDWNPVWDLAVGRFEGGWTVEAAVPFKSLRYQPGRVQTWGVNFSRRNLAKNEWSFVTLIPNSFGTRGLLQASLAGTLVGLEAPPASRNIELKPYAVTDLRSDALTVPRTSNDLGGNIGIDAKYGLTPNLTAHFTVNTDFAQVEADEQQINLTRFSLFFPEKREFFLENQGTFSFGGVATRGSGDAPVLFYSRRIGLNQGAVVPIDGGGRLSGRVGAFDLGVISMRTGDEPDSRTEPTTFSVVRVKRDIFRRSSIGAIVTNRSLAQSGSGSNDVYGLDGTFAFFNNLSVNTYWARSRTTGVSGDDTSHRLQFDYAGDRYGLQVDRLVVGDHFNPEVGFIRRDNMRRSFASARFSPRPANSRLVRRFSATGTVDYVQADTTGRRETREIDGEFAIEFQNTERFSVAYTDTHEFLPLPFRIAPGITLPVGGYDFSGVRIAHTFGRQRPVSGTAAVEHGTFYDGHKTAFVLSGSRVNPSSQLSFEPSYSINRVELSTGSFTTHLAGTRVTYTMTPLMFASALLQYNSTNHAVSANVRLRWEYQPGSELFVVFNEERNTALRGFPDFANRALIIKINRLLRL